MGYIYLLVEIDAAGGETYKIGITKNDPELRVKQLQTGNPNEIRVVHHYQSENYRIIERLLHKKYHGNRTLVQNEWFIIQPENVFSFMEDCKKNDETINFLKENNHFFK